MNTHEHYHKESDQENEPKIPIYETTVPVTSGKDKIWITVKSTSEDSLRESVNKITGLCFTKSETKTERYNTQDDFDRYQEVENLERADIFHLYDTGRECKPDNSGYHDSRHMTVWAFNSKTMQKCNLGIHDGLQLKERISVDIIRIYADGSTLIRTRELCGITAWDANHVDLRFQP